MPREIFTGPDVSALMQKAEAVLGADAVVLSVRRIAATGRDRFELAAADPATAALLRRPARAATLLAPAATVPTAGDDDGGPAVVALVGPTGAGKTTTIAKLANHPKVFGQRAVGLLGLDTYRIGGVEQLRIYGELSHLPVEIAYDVREIERALKRLRHCEVILVDTAGRGPRRVQDMEATRDQLARVRPLEVHLTLPAGLQPRHAHRIVEEHRALGVTHLIATKLDECPDDETVFDVAVACGLPMVWIADGQEVPEDLRPAGPRLAARMARDSALVGAA